jgi:adenylate cyclase
MVEEIITALSRFRSLFVIARNSSFIYKGRLVDIKQVGRELGVRYVLEGSVRRSADRVRITAQLIDALTGAHLWAERFDGALEDVFDLQDRVAERVVNDIEPRLAQVELERGRHKPTANLGAYDYYLRAAATSYPMTKERSEEVLRLAYKAIELDPGFASACGFAAWLHAWRGQNQWTDDVAQERADALRTARRAAEVGKEDAVALAWAAYTLAYVGRESEHAAPLADRAIELNPNLALAWGISGWARLNLGQLEIAIERLARGMRLSPFDPGVRAWLTATGVAHLLAGRYEESLSWTRRTMHAYPDFPAAWRVAATCYALAGRIEEAKATCARLRELEPQLRVRNIRDLFAPYRSADLAKFEEGLRMAGLPE